MPKRSNEFQRLIHLIETSLAPAGAVVEESAMLRSRVGGEETEVDVLITAPVGPRTVRIAVECRAHKRKQSATWIRDLDGKYRDLPVDRVVAVAQGGFYAPALAAARRLDIETRTLQEALAEDWADLVQLIGRVRLLSVIVKPTNVSLVGIVDVSGVRVDETAELLAPSGERLTLADLTLRLANEEAPAVVKQITNQVVGNAESQPDTRRGQGTVTRTMDGFRLVLGDGSSHDVLTLTYELRFEAEDAAVQLAQGRYGDSRFAAGQVTLGGESWHLVVGLAEGAQPTLAVGLPDGHVLRPGHSRGAADEETG